MQFPNRTLLGIIMKKLTILTVVVAIVFMFGKPASSSTTYIGSVNESTEATGANYMLSIDYYLTGSGTAELTLIITNTTSQAVGGYLTAFVFNNPSDWIQDISFKTTPGDNWAVASNTGSGSSPTKAAPFGTFDFVVYNNSNGSGFQGSGQPGTGIQYGTTAIFSFTITGTDLPASTEDFINAFFNETIASNEGEFFFVARFRGLANNCSDKVPGAVPIPGAAWLFGTGLLGLIGLRRKIKR